MMEGESPRRDDYTTEPWSWSGAGNGGSGAAVRTRHPQGGQFDPLTERMQQELDIRRYDVTATGESRCILWFTKPFVRSAVVDEQGVYPATMVLDEDGVGLAVWKLSEQAVFVVMDPDGSVVDVILGAPRRMT